MVYLQTTYELCFGEAYFEYFELCDFSHGNTNIDVSVFMFDLRMINMSSECEYDWYWKISACSTEYEACDSFASLTRHQTSYSGSAGWYFQYQSIHVQITYTYWFDVQKRANFKQLFCATCRFPHSYLTYAAGIMSYFLFHGIKL
jgi:hypothetical protein